MLQVSAENVALTRHKQYPATPLQPWAVSKNLRRGLFCPGASFAPLSPIDTRFETCNETSFLTVQRLSAATILFMCSNVYQMPLHLFRTMLSLKYACKC